MIDTVTFGQQFDNISQGRNAADGGSIIYLSTPSPGDTNAAAPPLPALTFVKGDGVINLALSVLPSFEYLVEYKDDLAAGAWIRLGPPAIATGPTLEFTDRAATGAQRFYRATRTP